jgi:hypothetical protein
MVFGSPNRLNPKNRIKTRETGRAAKQTHLGMNPYDIPESYRDFLEECCRIRSGNKFMPFLPYEYQVLVSDLIDKYRGVAIFKTRQMGATECISAKFLHKALLNPAYAAAVMSLGQKESSNVATRIQAMPSNVNNLAFLTKSKTEIHFQDAGKIWFRPATDNATRSLESISDLLFDEAAFPQNFEEIYSASAPSQEAVGDEARTVIASTMSELGKLSRFWQIFDDANPVDADEMVNRVKEGKEEPCTHWVDANGWAKVILHWRAHPVYVSIPDYLQRTKDKHKLTDSKLQREYNLGIPAFGGSLFNPEAISACAVGSWQLPKPGRHYMGMLDPNFGGSDFWEYLILDITELPYTIVAEYREQNRQSTFCVEKTLELSDIYRPLMMVIEHNSGGAVIAEKIVKTRTELRVETVNTSRVSKVQNTDRMALMIERGEINYSLDWAGIGEMKNFGLQDRRAISGHDDAVMCLAIGLAKLDDALKLRSNEMVGELGTVTQPQKRRFR